MYNGRENEHFTWLDLEQMVFHHYLDRLFSISCTGYGALLKNGCGYMVSSDLCSPETTPILYHRRQRKKESELAHVGVGETHSNLVNPSSIQSKSSYNCLP